MKAAVVPRCARERFQSIKQAGSTNVPSDKSCKQTACGMPSLLFRGRFELQNIPELERMFLCVRRDGSSSRRWDLNATTPR